MSLLDQQATYPSMKKGTREDFLIIEAHEAEFANGYADRVLEHLKLAKAENDGYPIDRFTHALQSATLAQRAGKDEEFIVCALLHDIGDHLAIHNHADIAAAILKPFISEQYHWMVEKHPIFQGYFYLQHFDMDPNLRDQYKGHPYYEITADFCEHFDQNAFDATYDTLPLEAFEPMLRRVFEKPRS